MSAHFARPERHDGLDRLQDRRTLRDLAYVDGHWSSAKGGQTFEVRDPASGMPVAWVAALGPQ